MMYFVRHFYRSGIQDPCTLELFLSIKCGGILASLFQLKSQSSYRHSLGVLRVCVRLRLRVCMRLRLRLCRSQT